MEMRHIWIYAHERGTPRLVRADTITATRVTTGPCTPDLTQIQALVEIPLHHGHALTWHTLLEAEAAPSGAYWPQGLQSGLDLLAEVPGSVAYAALEASHTADAGVHLAATVWTGFGEHHQHVLATEPNTPSVSL